MVYQKENTKLEESMYDSAAKCATHLIHLEFLRYNEDYDYVF